MATPREQELAVYVGPVVKTRPRRPCLIYQEVRFKPHDRVLGDARARLEKICFQNYYTASVTVQQLLHDDDEQEGGGGGGDGGGGDGGGDGGDGGGGGTWTTVLYGKQLMASPHYEDDAEAWHTIDVARDFNRNFRPDKKFAPLRFYLSQPSPNWISFELKHLSCYAVVDAPRGPRPPFIEGCGPRFTWFGGETGYEPEADAAAAAAGGGGCGKCARLGRGGGGSGGGGGGGIGGGGGRDRSWAGLASIWGGGGGGSGSGGGGDWRLPPFGECVRRYKAILAAQPSHDAYASLLPQERGGAGELGVITSCFIDRGRTNREALQDEADEDSADDWRR